MYDYITNAQELDESSGAVFEAIRSGMVKVDIGLKLPLLRARPAQEALAASETTGSTILIP